MPNKEKNNLTLNLSAASVAKFHDVSLSNFAEKAYLDYALSVVHGRAIPKLSDGLKPVQRRLLYSMVEMSLSSDAKPVKSARVVGDVLGKFHPHGDQSAYEAMVRMSQDFVMRYPLIDGQGNFGSRDGDGAAAMRYTEARLTAFANVLLDEIGFDTVSFLPNYDGSYQEPQELPARLPLCLINGASGIAVGLSTEIPSHNVGEIADGLVAILDNRKISNNEILNIIPGPDFPGGGQVINSRSELEEIYLTGKGTFITQGRWFVEELARSQWRLVFTELPHGVSVQKVLEEIDELTNPKIKANKKSLTSEQNKQKTMMMSYLLSVRDESDKNANVRLVFEPKNSKISKEEFIQLLLSKTSLQSSSSVNLVLLDLENKPKQLSLREILFQWLEFRVKIVKAKFAFKLKIVQKRLHILHGRIKILEAIAEVIKIIQESDNPKTKLMKRFALDQEQVQDILEMRLRQLAKIELLNIKAEIAKKKEEETIYLKVLKSKKSLEEQTKKEILSLKKLYGDDRRTLLKESAKVTFEAEVSEEKITVIISYNGWITIKNGHDVKISKIQFKTGDQYNLLFECTNLDYLISFSTSGRVYCRALLELSEMKIPELPFSSLVEPAPNESFHTFFVGKQNDRIIVLTQYGKGLTTKMDKVLSKTRVGKAFLKLEDGDKPLTIIPIPKEESALALLTNLGYLLVIGTNSVKELFAGGRGVKLIGLRPGDQIRSACLVGETGLEFRALTKQGQSKVLKLSRNKLLDFIGKRSQKGRKVNSRLTIESMK